MRAILVVCEGRSGIAFVRRSLIAIAACTGYNNKIGDFPAPFGAIPSVSKVGHISEKGVISRHIETCFGRKATDDRKLSGAVSLPPPNFDAAILGKDKDSIYLFVNAGGRSQHNSVIELLEGVDSAVDLIGDYQNVLLESMSSTQRSEYHIRRSSTADMMITKYAVAFLLDANNRGIENTVGDFRGSYYDFFGDLTHLDHAGWAKSDRCPVGLYICCNEEGKGALENYIIEMTESIWRDRHNKVFDFIKEHSDPEDLVLKSDTNMFKAIIATVGQFNFPGDSLFSVIDDRSKGIPDEQFKTSKECINLVKFIQDVPWED